MPACCAGPAFGASAACTCISESCPAHSKGQEAAVYSSSMPGVFPRSLDKHLTSGALSTWSVARLHANVFLFLPLPTQMQAVVPETKQLEDSYALPGKPAYESVPHMCATCHMPSMRLLCCA